MNAVQSSLAMDGFKCEGKDFDEELEGIRIPLDHCIGYLANSIHCYEVRLARTTWTLTVKYKT